MSSSDPVLWVKHGSPGATAIPRVWDAKAGRYVRPVDDFGQPVRERVPAVGFVGRDLQSMRKMSGVRSIRILNSAGNEVHYTLTTSAAIAARDDDAYRNDRLRKARHFGWIQVGSCPCAERFRGVPAARFISKEAREGQPCDPSTIGTDEDGHVNPPCQHYLAEQMARREIQAKQNAAANLRHTDGETKRSDAMARLAEAQQAQAQALTAVAETLTAQATDPAPKGGK